MPAPRLLFLTLNTFSSTGGIEKVCRVAGKALYELASERGGSACLLSMYDKPADAMKQYVPASSFAGYAGNRLRFVWAAVNQGQRSTHVVLSHINLLAVGLLIKVLSPTTKVFLIAHGIEVWVPLPAWKKAALKKLDGILPVSRYTRQRMIDLYELVPNKFTVVNNCLDPFLAEAASEKAIAELRKTYGLNTEDKVLLTLARLSFSEQYKGYDKVIAALPDVLKTHPTVKYLLAGKWDEEEKNRLNKLIQRFDVADRIIFTGFVPDKELAALFGVADAYVMPSTGEGFGIVFIEALFYGKPVIAGNRDGSVDALAGGSFGKLIDPCESQELVAAIDEAIAGGVAVPRLTDVLKQFGFDAYKLQLSTALKLVAS